MAKLFFGCLCGTVMLMTLPPAVAQNLQIIDNGTIRTGVYGGGQVGGDCSGSHPGFALNGGDSVLCGGSFLVATSPTNVIGDNYTILDGSVDWTQGTWSDTSSPFWWVEVGHTTSFSDVEGVGIDVDFSVYYSDDDDFAEQFFIGEYAVTNNSGSTLDLTLGMWMDWNIDPATTNEAEHDGTDSQWVFGDGSGVTELFGTRVVLGAMEGTGCSHPISSGDMEVYSAMTSLGPSPCAPGDIRGPIGAGTRTVADGEVTSAFFCFIGASDLADFEAQAHNCYLHLPSIEPNVDGTPGTHSLGSAYPNPFNPQTRFTLEVARHQSVRIAVYDELGREVAVLHDGALEANFAHSFMFDGSGLPSGVYLVAVTGGHFSEMRQIALQK